MLPGLTQSGFGPPGQFPGAAALPTVVEDKIFLDGRRKQFACRVLESAPEHLVVLFVSDQPYVVEGWILPAGTVTFGHFWSARPYNVYHWMDSAGRTLGHYFNLSADTVITDGKLSWRDLVVDVLVRPGEPPKVLDESELPANLPHALRLTVDAARDAVLAEQESCIAETEARADELWRALGGQERQRE